mmetsp:Transcript_11577/g.20120  ORF Transcript_11577/g.20120 Transcript_11577/m.20120 type:complete len:423 (+) Transcript_11577:101-1369(+)
MRPPQTNRHNRNDTPCRIPDDDGRSWNSLRSTMQSSMRSIGYVHTKDGDYDSDDDELDRLFAESARSKGDETSTNPMIVSRQNSTMSIESNHASTFDRLRKDYDAAVQCLMHCETLINDLQDQLKDKDDHITGLEEQLVEMSLELAAAKAFEDEHKAKRRVSCFSEESDIDLSSSFRDEELTKSPPRPEKKNARARRASSLPKHEEPEEHPAGANGERPQHRKSWWGGNRGDRAQARAQARAARAQARARGRGQAKDQAPEPQAPERTHQTSITLDEATRPHEFDESYRTAHESLGGLDESSSSRLSLNIGALFRKNRNNSHLEEEKGTISEEELQQQQADSSHRSHRVPNRNRRMLVKQKSSFFDEGNGVIFPSSFESVVIRGCVELGNSFKESFKGGIRGLSKEDEQNIMYDVDSGGSSK